MAISSPGGLRIFPLGIYNELAAFGIPGVLGGGETGMLDSGDGLEISSYGRARTKRIGIRGNHQ